MCPEIEQDVKITMMKNTSMPVDDAKKALEILSKAYKFIVCTKRECIEMKSGEEVLDYSDEWTVYLKWSSEVAKKMSDALFVTFGSMLAKNKKDKNCIVAKCSSKLSAYVEIVRCLSGAKLEKYNSISDRFEVVHELPRFSSLSELKMNFAIQGLECL